MIKTLRASLVATSLLGLLGCGDNVLYDTGRLNQHTGGTSAGGALQDIPANGGASDSSTGGSSPAISGDGAGKGGGASVAQVDSAPNPLTAPPTCTSMTRWNGSEGERMRPGSACIACHESEDEGPRFAIAGTVYSTGHEPNDCNGVTTSLGAVVVVTGADGRVHRMSVNSAGNFMFEDRVVLPYTAKVTSSAGERLMATPQMDGDCNGCHTQDGANGAPGRIVPP
jgi:mono/diheme cytochrome c family protein